VTPHCGPKPLRVELSTSLTREMRAKSAMSLRSPLFARYPPTGAWPLMMRADMAAAYLDYRDTGELARGVSPRRSASTERLSRYRTCQRTDLVENCCAIDSFLESSSGIESHRRTRDFASLV
jgi:hypothetical protein